MEGPAQLFELMVRQDGQWNYGPVVVYAVTLPLILVAALAMRGTPGDAS